MERTSVFDSALGIVAVQQKRGAKGSDVVRHFSERVQFDLHCLGVVQRRSTPLVGIEEHMNYQAQRRTRDGTGVVTGFREDYRVDQKPIIALHYSRI